MSSVPTSIANSAPDHTIIIRNVDLPNKRIYFQSGKSTPEEQLLELRSPEAEKVYVDAAKEKLSMTSPGISSQSTIYIDTKTNQTVSPRVKEQSKSTMESELGIKSEEPPVIPVWYVEFNSMFD